MRERFTPENLHYAIIENGRHDIDACERYLYYGLQDFFGQTETSAENAEEEVLGESDGEEEGKFRKQTASRSSDPLCQNRFRHLTGKYRNEKEFRKENSKKDNKK